MLVGRGDKSHPAHRGGGDGAARWPNVVARVGAGSIAATAACVAAPGGGETARRNPHTHTHKRRWDGDGPVDWAAKQNARARDRVLGKRAEVAT